MLKVIKKHTYLNFDLMTLLSVLLALLVVPFLSSFPEKYGYENGLIENIQMIVLFTGFAFAVVRGQ